MRYTTLSGVAALATVLVNGESAVPAVAVSGGGISVPCDTTSLINAIATAPTGSTLVFARAETHDRPASTVMARRKAVCRVRLSDRP